MNIHKQSVLVIVLTAVFLVAACKSGKEKPAGNETTFEQAMESKDTVAVKQLVDRFFTFAKEENYSEAAGMLYRNDEDIKGEPEPLDNDGLAEVISMLKTIHPVDYRIEYIKFNEYYANEVLCHVVLRKAEGDMPDITTKMFFKPVNYMGNWLLCLTNTEYGDRGVVDPNKRDSAMRAYNAQQNESNSTEK
ncbi:MAG: hypothetical protein J6K19_04430 [Prevotella sp.]|nr:hypothetical protein [Prevotella sp.]